MCDASIDSKEKSRHQNMAQRAEKRESTRARKLQENLVRRVQQGKAIDVENQTKSMARALRKKDQINQEAKRSR